MMLVGYHGYVFSMNFSLSERMILQGIFVLRMDIGQMIPAYLGGGAARNLPRCSRNLLTRQRPLFFLCLIMFSKPSWNYLIYLIIMKKTLIVSVRKRIWRSAATCDSLTAEHDSKSRGWSFLCLPHVIFRFLGICVVFLTATMGGILWDHPDLSQVWWVAVSENSWFSHPNSDFFLDYHIRNTQIFTHK